MGPSKKIKRGENWQKGLTCTESISKNTKFRYSKYVAYSVIFHLKNLFGCNLVFLRGDHDDMPLAGKASFLVVSL